MREITMKKKRKKPWLLPLCAIIIFCIAVGFWLWTRNTGYIDVFSIFGPREIISRESIPEYTGRQWIFVNNNQPYFSEEEKAITDTFERYAPLDYLGRATEAMALVSRETMPLEDRMQLFYTPTGWQQVQYDFIDNGGWLYNRCHLIGYQLTAEQDNPGNLITGTRQFNVNGMMPFEIQALQYIEKYNGRCLYRVTPYYNGDDLLAYGVLMESYSQEDPRAATFCVFVYNVQDGVVLDYATGYSHLANEESVPMAFAS